MPNIGNNMIYATGNEVKAADKNYKCECGGEYIEIDKMKWIEDKDEK